MNHSLGYVLLVLAIYVLVAARLTKLINSDKITDPLRLAIARPGTAALNSRLEAQAAGQSALAEEYGRKVQRWKFWYEFAQCPWCVGWWVSLIAGVPVVWHLRWSWWWLVPLALAASHLIGIGAVLAEDDDIRVVDADKPS